MTFSELIKHYGFKKKSDGILFKQWGVNVWYVIEIHEMDTEKKECKYTFYKIIRHQRSYTTRKDYEVEVDELFLVSSVKKHFNYLKKLEREKKLKPYGDSKNGYYQHLKEQRIASEKAEKEIPKQWEMIVNNLELHDGKKGRKQSPNQMKMKF